MHVCNLRAATLIACLLPLVGTDRLGDQAESQPTVYSIETSSDYHTASCYLRKSFASSPMTLQAAEARQLKPCFSCRPHERDEAVVAVMNRRRAVATAAAEAREVANVAELAAKTDTDGTVYTFYGSSDFHLATCSLAKGRAPLAPTTSREAKRAGKGACPLCKPLAHAIVKAIDYKTAIDGLMFASITVRNIRAAPELSSEVLGRTENGLDLRRVFEARTGWLRVDLDRKAGTSGWVKAAADDVVPRDLLDAYLVRERLSEEALSLDLKVAVLRKEVRVGLSRRQVEIALGEPTSKVTEETAAGVTEVWSYPARSITFGKGVVVSIRTFQ